MSNKTYFCDNPKCKKHILAEKVKYQGYTKYVGYFETIFEDNHETVTNDGKTFNFCNTCTNVLAMTHGVEDEFNKIIKGD